MKILVVSDNHGDCANLRKVAEQEQDIGQVFHLGDFERTDHLIREMFDVPVEFVAGNMDFSSRAPSDLLVRKGGHNILLTHGHTHMVNAGIQYLAQDAAEMEASIALYGHTHVPASGQWNGVFLFNPGSISKPRQADGRFTYGILTLCEGADPQFEIRAVEGAGEKLN